MLSPYPPVRTSGDIAATVRDKMNKIESDEKKSFTIKDPLSNSTVTTLSSL